mmetsp:Transcript_5121/g.15516  ORF Transcript_5121/g.15516 Transcript_5121/m.15516 type:complete len:105 (-) Transcript_5121:81-395(-)
MVLLSQDAFLTEMTRLFQNTRESGSLSLTFKRVTEKAGDDDDEKKRHRCLIRARTEKKKISTVVDAKDVLKFQGSLCGLMKVSMSNLKRKERAKKDKKTEDSKS